MINAIFRSSAGALLCLVSIVCAAEPTGHAAQLIQKLKMERIADEGAWFSGTYRSEDAFAGSEPTRYGDVPHVLGSAIYALVTREDFSAMHQLRTDEIWHYYAGDPLELLLLHPDGRGEVVILGPDVLRGQQPQVVVRRGVWQGAKPSGRHADSYTLFGCTLAPGFEYGDFTIGYRDELQKAYPAFAAQVAALTRQPFATRPTSPASDVSVPEVRSDVFAPADVQGIKVASGIVLHELAGRNARVKSDAYSIALFTLDSGKSMPASYNKSAEEIFLVTSGTGEVMLDGQVRSVATGSIVMMKPQVRHSIRAAGESSLSFYAISSPAFSPDDYVVDDN